MAQEAGGNPGREPGGEPAGGPGRGKERRLIEAAMGQASPRPESWSFSPDLPPADTFPGYELVREVHRGGQGAVYLAIQKATKRRVAIKVMHGGPFAGSAGRARFEREVQILGQLNHPNIVAIHDSGVTGDGSCFYVMDYISGRTLDAFIRTDSRPPVAETLRLFQRICEAVNAAHLRGVIHRDLKPANIRVDPSGEPVVVDFGLAKIAVPDVTAETSPQLMSMTGQFIGSLPWASPEQAQGSPGGIDVRTDVYSLGVILYQLLTGRFPYEVVGNMRDVLDNILRAEPARPSTIRRQINDEVETIVLRCLAKEKERRYQSAGDLARDIERYLAGEPIEAKRASGWYVLSKTIRKHRLSVGVVAAAVIGIAVFAVVMSVLYGQVSRARKDTAAALSREQQASARAVAERDRAQSNLELVRRLARASVNEFDEGIANLRGATPVRLRLIEVAQASLAELLPQAGENPELLREIAAAYDRLGDLHGGLFLPKVGDIAAATGQYAEALRLREQVLSARPGEARSHADQGESHLRLGGALHQAARFADAEGEHALAAGAFERAIRMAGGDPVLVREFSDRRDAALVAGADAVFQRAESAPDASDAVRLVEQASDAYRRSLLYWTDRADAAPQDLDAAIKHARAIEKVSKAFNLGARKRRTLASKIADDPAVADAGYAEVVTLLESSRRRSEEALGLFAALSAAHPAEARLRRDMYLSNHNIGYACLELGQTRVARARANGVAEDEARNEGLADRARAMETFQNALEIAEALARTDEKNLEAQRDHAICLNKVGNEWDALREYAKAEAVFAASLEIRERTMLTDPTQRHRRDRAVALFKCGEQAAKAGDRADAAEKAAHYRRSLELLGRAQADYRVLIDDGVLAAAAEHPTYLAKVIAQVEAKLAEASKP